MVSFQTKNPNLGKFWRVLYWKMLLYFMAIWNIWDILCPFGTFCVHLVCTFFLALVSCTKKNLATLAPTGTCRRHKVSVEAIPGDPVRGYDHDDNHRDDEGPEPEDPDPDRVVLAPELPESNDSAFFAAGVVVIFIFSFGK
jgi:hypothetical protein